MFFHLYAGLCNESVTTNNIKMNLTEAQQINKRLLLLCFILVPPQLKLDPLEQIFSGHLCIFCILIYHGLIVYSLINVHSDNVHII